jgi:hypothetical protein
MIPLRRCGSHALRLRLNASPSFHSPYPLHIVDFMPLVPMYGDLSDDSTYRQMVEDVVGLQQASMVKWPGVEFHADEIFNALQDEPRSVHRIVWELLLRSAEAHGASVAMDKSLDSVQYAHELMDLFPDMRFLNVVRDPRAQVASMNRAIIHDFDTTLNAQAWVKAHTAGRALALHYPERVLTHLPLHRHRVPAADAGHRGIAGGAGPVPHVGPVGIQLLRALACQQGQVQDPAATP